MSNWIERLKAEDEREAWGARCVDCGAPARAYDHGRKQSPYCEKCWDRWTAEVTEPKETTMEMEKKVAPQWINGFCHRTVATVALVLLGGGLLVVLGVMWRLIRWGFGF